MEDCAHPNTEIRKMTHCNQVKQQCLDCGMAVGNPIKHAAIQPDVLATIQEFDTEFRDLMIERRNEIWRIEREARQAEWIEQLPEKKEQYRNYLTSPEWKQKRALVIDRENGLCQGCRQSPITEVHHSTYKTVGNELLFQLVGLCSPCHRLAHPEHNKA